MSQELLDQRAAEAMVRLLHEHRRGGDEDDLAAAIHPQAEMRLLITYGTVLHGGATITAALENARRNAELYDARVRRFSSARGAQSRRALSPSPGPMRA